MSARRRQGDQGIAAAAMAALAPWARPPTRCALVGAAPTALDREGFIATCRSMTAPWAIKRVERARKQKGEGGNRRGGEDGGKLVEMPSLAGLGPSRRSCTTTDSAR